MGSGNDKKKMVRQRDDELIVGLRGVGQALCINPYVDLNTTIRQFSDGGVAHMFLFDSAELLASIAQTIENPETLKRIVDVATDYEEASISTVLNQILNTAQYWYDDDHENINAVKLVTEAFGLDQVKQAANVHRDENGTAHHVLRGVGGTAQWTMDLAPVLKFADITQRCQSNTVQALTDYILNQAEHNTQPATSIKNTLEVFSHGDVLDIADNLPYITLETYIHNVGFAGQTDTIDKAKKVARAFDPAMFHAVEQKFGRNKKALDVVTGHMGKAAFISQEKDVVGVIGNFAINWDGPYLGNALNCLSGVATSIPEINTLRNTGQTLKSIPLEKREKTLHTLEQIVHCSPELKTTNDIVNLSIKHNDWLDYMYQTVLSIAGWKSEKIPTIAELLNRESITDASRKLSVQDSQVAMPTIINTAYWTLDPRAVDEVADVSFEYTNTKLSVVMQHLNEISETKRDGESVRKVTNALKHPEVKNFINNASSPNSLDFRVKTMCRTALGTEDLTPVLTIAEFPKKYRGEKTSKKHRGEKLNSCLKSLSEIALSTNKPNSVRNIANISLYAGASLDNFLIAARDIATAVNDDETIEEITELAPKYDGRNLNAIMESLKVNAEYHKDAAPVRSAAEAFNNKSVETLIKLYSDWDIESSIVKNLGKIARWTRSSEAAVNIAQSLIDRSKDIESLLEKIGDIAYLTEDAETINYISAINIKYEGEHTGSVLETLRDLIDTINSKDLTDTENNKVLSRQLTSIAALFSPERFESTVEATKRVVNKLDDKTKISRVIELSLEYPGAALEMMIRNIETGLEHAQTEADIDKTIGIFEQDTAKGFIKEYAAHTSDSIFKGLVILSRGAEDMAGLNVVFDAFHQPQTIGMLQNYTLEEQETLDNFVLELGSTVQYAQTTDVIQPVNEISKKCNNQELSQIMPNLREILYWTGSLAPLQKIPTLQYSHEELIRAVESIKQTASYSRDEELVDILIDKAKTQDLTTLEALSSGIANVMHYTRDLTAAKKVPDLTTPYSGNTLLEVVKSVVTTSELTKDGNEVAKYANVLHQKSVKDVIHNYQDSAQTKVIERLRKTSQLSEADTVKTVAVALNQDAVRQTTQTYQGDVSDEVVENLGDIAYTTRNQNVVKSVAEFANNFNNDYAGTATGYIGDMITDVNDISFVAPVCYAILEYQGQDVKKFVEGLKEVAHWTHDVNDLNDTIRMSRLYKGRVADAVMQDLSITAPKLRNPIEIKNVISQYLAEASA